MPWLKPAARIALIRQGRHNPRLSPSGSMRWGCHLLLCNLAEPARCPPGHGRLALSMVPADKEQVWRLLQPLPSSSSSPMPLCLWVFLSLTLHFFVEGVVSSPNCLLLGIENRSPRLFQRYLWDHLWDKVWAKELLGAASWVPAPAAGLMSTRPQGAAHTGWHSLPSLLGTVAPIFPVTGGHGADCSQRCVELG